MALSDDEVIAKAAVTLAAELADDSGVTPPEEIGVVYAGPHGSVVDGAMAFPRGEVVRTTAEQLARLRRLLPGHTFHETT